MSNRPSIVVCGKPLHNNEMSADQSLDHTVTSHKECCYKMSVSLNALSVFFIGLFYFVESRVLDVTIIAGTKLIDLSKSLCVRLSITKHDKITISQNIIYCCHSIRTHVADFFAERVLNVWNCLPPSANYSTLIATFRRSTEVVDF